MSLHHTSYGEEDISSDVFDRIAVDRPSMMLGNAILNTEPLDIHARMKRDASLGESGRVKREETDEKEALEWNDWGNFADELGDTAKYIPEKGTEGHVGVGDEDMKEFEEEVEEKIEEELEEDGIDDP